MRCQYLNKNDASSNLKKLADIDHKETSDSESLSSVDEYKVIICDFSKLRKSQTLRSSPVESMKMTKASIKALILFPLGINGLKKCLRNYNQNNLFKEKYLSFLY